MRPEQRSSQASGALTVSENAMERETQTDAKKICFLKTQRPVKLSVLGSFAIDAGAKKNLLSRNILFKQ